MTIEIRQMVIKSSIDRGEAAGADESAPAADEHDGEGGNSEGNLGGSEERRRLRMLLATQFERMRER
ncbi:DUF5908 family protein [Dyella acidiphila]|uniref:Uncharacterized protein n=1 Tax=Dyella acidiphila TaxID=2775866 RepID=A0ABR9G9G4_9GAMM|nr:DUF5908 family protein [Dyella acidiphila]MBE1160682.1 hypothetical protein [Dyella acidiphila]